MSNDDADLTAHWAIHRFTIPVDDADHRIECLRFLAIDPRNADIVDEVDVYCLVDLDLDGTMMSREFRVFGTGQPIPHRYVYSGTASKAHGLMWHVMEVMEP